jgi:uncharacterized protein (TIGR03067 family)
MLNATLKGLAGAVERAWFSPDGKTLTTVNPLQQVFGGVSLFRSEVRDWDLATGREKARCTLPGPTAAVSADGKTFARRSTDGTTLWFLDRQTRRVKSQLAAPGEPFRYVGLSADGSRAVTTEHDPQGSVFRVWDVAGGRELGSGKSPLEATQAPVFAPDGKALAAVLRDQSVVVLKAPSCQVKVSVPGNRWAGDRRGGRGDRGFDGGFGMGGDRAPVCRLAFSPDSSLLAFGGDSAGFRGRGSGELVVWDLAAGRERWREGTSGLRDLEFSPDGRTLAAGCGAPEVGVGFGNTGALGQECPVVLWDVATGKVQRILQGHSRGLSFLAFSPDGRLLASGDHFPVVHVWKQQMAEEKARQELERLQGTWEAVAVERGQQPLDSDHVRDLNLTLVVRGDRWTLQTQGVVEQAGRVSVDPTRTPRALDFWVQEGLAADKTIPGIYELRGDSLEICYGDLDQERPAEFKTRPNTTQAKILYQRVK